MRGAGLGVGGATLFRAAEDGPRGWRSTRYGERQPALELELAVEAAAADFATLLGPGSIRLSYAEDTLLAAGDGWQALVTLRAAGEPGPLVRAASLAGPEEDLLYPENA